MEENSKCDGENIWNWVELSLTESAVKLLLQYVLHCHIDFPACEGDYGFLVCWLCDAGKSNPF